jgi:hypothetical protein
LFDLRGKYRKIVIEFFGEIPQSFNRLVPVSLFRDDVVSLVGREAGRGDKVNELQFVSR